MKRSALTIAVLPLMLVLRSGLPVSGPRGACELILHAPIVTQRDFDVDLLDVPSDPQWTRLTRIDLKAVWERDMQESDTAWVLESWPFMGAVSD